MQSTWDRCVSLSHGNVFIMTLTTLLLQVTWSFLTPVDVALAAEKLHNPKIQYNGAYQQMTYPMGDIPADQGVCTDVVIRAFRLLGIDLQVEIHEMIGGDPNIVHRRVPNIAAYLEQSEDWGLTTETPQPGDVIWWKVPMNHIGIVTTSGMVMHNIGRGQVADVRYDEYDIFKVFRLRPPS